MLKIGLDIGTGFVKCVSNYGSVRFPSVYVKRVHGHWTSKDSEMVGARAQAVLSTMGASAISPIRRGRPDQRYQRQVEMLLKETMTQLRKLAKIPAGEDKAVRAAVGLPYHAFDYRDPMVRLVKKALGAEKCIVVAQASGTLVDLGRESGIVVSIGQGTTEIIVIDDLEVIDGESSGWASGFVTKKIGKFAHLDIPRLVRNQDVCKPYSKIMAENLVREICEVSENYDDRYPIALSGGGLLIPGMNDVLLSGLKKFKVMIPDDPVMSNARGLYKMAA